MYVNFKGKKAVLYTDYKQQIRQFNVNAEIVNAQVQGNSNDSAIIALTMKNGKTILYKSNGQIIRR